MAYNNYYFYDEEDCKFVPVHYQGLERMAFTASLWILCGVVFAGVAIVSLSSFAGTPSEIALKAENQELVKQLKKTKSTIEGLDNKVSNLAETDNEIFRSMLGMDAISYDERKAGAGGADIYSNFDVYDEETSQILKWTANNLDNLERRINIQKTSFEEVKKYYNNNRNKMMHIPAIRPVKGIILSGFGMRYHPILKYRRMHEGVDFRAKVGTPVHATGDGIVKYAKRKGTFGRYLVIDHGFGLKSSYAHLSAFKKGIKPGTKVKRGEVVAFTGSSGLTEGPHLHYQVMKNGKPVDPLNYLFGDITPDEYAMYQEIAKNNPNSMD